MNQEQENARDLLDEVQASYDLALKAAGRRLVAIQIKPGDILVNAQEATEALRVYKRIWRHAQGHLRIVRGGDNVDTAIKKLGLPQEN